KLRCGGDVAAWPRNMLERNELDDQHAVMRGLRDRKVKIARQPGEAVEVCGRFFGLAQERAQFRDVGGGRVFSGKLSAERLDRPLRVHDLCGRYAREVELHGERLCEQSRITLRDAGTAAFAHANFDDAEGLKGAQR